MLIGTISGIIVSIARSIGKSEQHTGLPHLDDMDKFDEDCENDHHGQNHDC